MKLTDTTIENHRWGKATLIHPTLTAGKTRKILAAAKERMNPEARATVNKSLTKGQALQILSGAVTDEMPDDQPISSIVARNIIREFGKFYKEPA